MTQQDNSEVHLPPGSVPELVTHKYPFTPFDIIDLQEGYLRLEEIQKKWPEEQFTVDCHGCGIALDITYNNKEDPPLIVTMGDGVSGERINSEHAVWVWPTEEIKTDKEVNLKILLLYQPPNSGWTETDVKKQVMSALRHGPIEHDYPMLHTRVLAMRVDGQPVSVYDYWDYVKGAIPGLQKEAEGKSIMDDFQWAFDQISASDYRFIPDGVFVDLQEPRPDINFKPFLVKVRS